MGDRGRIDVAFFQFNPGFYSNQSYLPYSAGILWAYARTFPEIEDRYRNIGFFFIRQDAEELVRELEHVDVAAFSTYLWNWEISNAVAVALKRRFPHVLTIFGGPHVPNDASSLLSTHRHIDIAVHGEGELTLADILKEHLGGKNYGSIPGLSFNDGKKIQCLQAVRDPVRDLDELPSPYLTGVFDSLLKQPYQFQATWETNRGCPYKCTFCYWGTDYDFVQKLRKFSFDRLTAELEYFGDHKITFIYLADANFGIIERDLEIAERLAAVKVRKKGYPVKFKANYAKNSTERVVEIARILNREKLDKGIGLAIQSMDQEALVNIKRKNLKIESFARFMHQYKREGISTYVELILGLPGETYSSFRDGIDRLLVAGAHDSLFLHKCVILPNTEMDTPAYRAEHGIRTVRVPATLTHSSTPAGSVQETEELVIETATMSADDWKASFLLAWAIQTFHVLRLTQVPAIAAYAHERLPFGAFYEALIEFGRRAPNTLIGEELKRTEDVVEKVLRQGKGFDAVLPEFSDISWSPEEASFLRTCLQLDRFYSELADFLCDLSKDNRWSIGNDILADVLKYQRAIIVKWDRDGTDELLLSCGVHTFYGDYLKGYEACMKSGRFRVVVEDDLKYGGDKERFSREIVFWGRRGGRMTYDKVHEHPLEVLSGPDPSPPVRQASRLIAADATSK
jgi:radical SAM superfamily enzyme YgiQ (UPF0313 family)